MAPSEAHTLPEPTIVWVCADCNVYTEESENLCPSMCATESGWERRQRRRRGYICADCSEDTNMWLSSVDFIDAHQAEQPSNQYS